MYLCQWNSLMPLPRLVLKYQQCYLPLVAIWLSVQIWKQGSRQGLSLNYYRNDFELMNILRRVLGIPRVPWTTLDKGCSRTYSEVFSIRCRRISIWSIVWKTERVSKRGLIFKTKLNIIALVWKLHLFLRLKKLLRIICLTFRKVEK